jgi:hypothetical protein
LHNKLIWFTINFISLLWKKLKDYIQQIIGVQLEIKRVANEQLNKLPYCLLILTQPNILIKARLILLFFFLQTND